MKDLAWRYTVAFTQVVSPDPIKIYWRTIDYRSPSNSPPLPSQGAEDKATLAAAIAAPLSVVFALAIAAAVFVHAQRQV